MINRSSPMAPQGVRAVCRRRSLALSILVGIFALHVVAQIASIEQTCAALLLFLGCAGIVIDNVLRASRQPLPSVRGLSKML